MAGAAKKRAVAALLVFSLITPWGVPQTITWLSMLVNYSRQAGLRRGMAMTFDGEHPCRLCCLLKKERAEEKQAPGKTLVLKDQLQLALPPQAAPWFYPPGHEAVWADVQHPAQISSRPPAPPPRSA